MDGGPQLQRRQQPEQSVLHRAVREGWPLVLAEAEGRGGLPKRVHEEVQRYLACGDIRRGLTLATCCECSESVVIAFSCKSRGWCPSCAARRAHEAEAHLDDVLPKVAFRQWTLSVPYALRWVLVKDVKLLRAVERNLTRAVFRWQRQRARQLGVAGQPKNGAVSFTQLFNAQLGLQPHTHLLVAEGVWSGATFVPLPPPDQEEVEAVLKRLLKRLRRLFEGLEQRWPEDGFDALQLEGAQLRLQLEEEPKVGRGRLVAVGQGFSLHAGTWVHGNDRDGLLRLVRYGARGPIAESRLSRREDGKYEYQTKRGATLVLTAAQLVKRLLWLIPPKSAHLTNFYGAFSSHSASRPNVLPRAAAAAAKKEPIPQQSSLPGVSAPAVMKRPRLDWAALHARTWGVDVWQCPCGGKRKVVAVVTSRRTAFGVAPEPGPAASATAALAQRPGPAAARAVAVARHDPLHPATRSRRPAAPTACRPR